MIINVLHSVKDDKLLTSITAEPTAQATGLPPYVLKCIASLLSDLAISASLTKLQY